MPPKLTIAHIDSLGEQIQRAFPDARVVKALHTVFVEVMIDPKRLPGMHNIFVAGDDANAKQTVRTLLGEFGWPHEPILDLGGISAARATEMYAQLYFTLVGALGTFDSTSPSCAPDRLIETTLHGDSGWRRAMPVNWAFTLRAELGW